MDKSDILFEFACSWFWPRLSSFPLFVSCLSLFYRLLLPYIFSILLLLFFLMIYVIYIICIFDVRASQLKELSKIVSLCTLVSKKNLVVFSHYMSIDLQIIYMYCHQSMSYNLVKLIFSLLYCVLKISVNRGANMSTAQ